MHVAAGNDDAARRQGMAAHLYDPTVRTLMLEGVWLRAGDHGIALFRQAARIAGPVFAAPRAVVEEIRDVAAYRHLPLGDIHALESVAIDHHDLAMATHLCNALAQVLEHLVQPLVPPIRPPA